MVGGRMMKCGKCLEPDCGLCKIMKARDELLNWYIDKERKERKEKFEGMTKNEIRMVMKNERYGKNTERI